ncbi:head maturation protease, ClpP-related [Alkalihalobacillus sp. LMS39]|uniref:head maturation protease, ClpP-related n=1 Tax=Alkalihalobacillus sp. LMS39 TaxID=2924032 RepID=UPI001FB1C78B|nr:head maturation protease, ClpP-related [Alkalihalobacillus sp. LMS39]UOE96069.1 Clp protease ClpP [Alkalihalobacillus sp. LMS39]
MTKKRFRNEKYNTLPKIDKVFKAEAIDTETSKITIYGDIGESWWGEYITATDVENALKNITTSSVHVHVNSYGGDVFDGIAIYNQLKNHSAKIIMHIDGIAASAASIIAMAGDEIVMGLGSMLMIHEGSTFAWGTKTDIRKTLNALEGIDKSIADIYMGRYKGERNEIDTMIVNETWFTSNEAVEVGLADRVDEEQEVVENSDPEDFKNSVLQRFRQKHQKASNPEQFSTNENILIRLKRQA